MDWLAVVHAAASEGVEKGDYMGGNFLLLLLPYSLLFPKIQMNFVAENQPVFLRVINATSRSISSGQLVVLNGLRHQNSLQFPTYPIPKHISACSQQRQIYRAADGTKTIWAKKKIIYGM